MRGRDVGGELRLLPVGRGGHQKVQVECDMLKGKFLERSCRRLVEKKAGRKEKRLETWLNAPRLPTHEFFLSTSS